MGIRQNLKPGEVIVEERLPFWNWKEYKGKIIEMRDGWFGVGQYVIEYYKNNIKKYCLARKIVDDTGGGVHMTMYNTKKDIEYKE